MIYDDMNGVGFVLIFFQSGMVALNSGIAMVSGARILDIKFLIVPAILVLILAAAFIFVHFYFPQLLHRGYLTLKSMFSHIKMPKKKEDKIINDVLNDSGFEYDPKQDIFYSEMNGWQREFGYCRLYDEAAAPSGMVIDCEPIYFDYGGKKWLIELWKGQYGMTTGCEIGVFATKGPEINIPNVFNGTFYNSISDADRLQMSFTLKKNKKIIMARDEMHWWLTGFKLGEFSEPWELKMDVEITLKDDLMCYAFVQGLKAIGYSDQEMIIKENSVGIKYAKPHSPQPITRTAATDWIIQRNNEMLCLRYSEAIGKNENMADKLKVIQKKHPEMMNEVVNIRKSKQAYDSAKHLKVY